MAFTEDLAPFFADFATPATLAGQGVQGIFDAAYALGQVGIGMASTQPTYTLPTASVVGEPVGQALVIGAVTYIVAAAEPDGTGITRLLLERAA